MTSERALRGIVGMFVLAGLALMEFHSRNWVYFLILVGGMLIQSGLTDKCPLRWILEKAGLPRCAPVRTPESKPALSRS
jgi:hypothetical protein